VRLFAGVTTVARTEISDPEENADEVVIVNLTTTQADNAPCNVDPANTELVPSHTSAARRQSRRRRKSLMMGSPGGCSRSPSRYPQRCSASPEGLPRIFACTQRAQGDYANAGVRRTVGHSCPCLSVNQPGSPPTQQRRSTCQSTRFTRAFRGCSALMAGALRLITQRARRNLHELAWPQLDHVISGSAWKHVGTPERAA